MEYVYLIRRVPTVMEMLGNLNFFYFQDQKDMEMNKLFKKS